MPRVCAYSHCSKPYDDSSSPSSSRYLHPIRPCDHKKIYAHARCESGVNKLSMRCKSCVNHTSLGEIADQGLKNFKRRATGYVNDPLGETGRFLERSFHRGAGAVEVATSSKPKYANRHQRDGGELFRGATGKRDVPVDSYGQLIGRRSVQAAEVAGKVYPKAAPFVKMIPSSSSKQIKYK